MAYFKDLTPYTYSLHILRQYEKQIPTEGLLNVGWLDPSREPFEAAVRGEGKETKGVASARP